MVFAVLVPRGRAAALGRAAAGAQVRARGSASAGTTVRVEAMQGAEAYEKREGGWGPPDAEAKRLVLVRHGEVDLTQFNGRKAFYGGLDVPLSATGQREAHAAARILGQREKVDRLWSSPLSRAVFGARCIAVAQGLPEQTIVMEDAFREVDRGGWVGLTADEVGQEAIDAWNRDPNFPMPGGGESLAAVAARVLAAKDKVRHVIRRSV